jgi:hypothetical protein
MPPRGHRPREAQRDDLLLRVDVDRGRLAHAGQPRIGHREIARVQHDRAHRLAHAKLVARAAVEVVAVGVDVNVRRDLQRQHGLRQLPDRSAEARQGVAGRLRARGALRVCRWHHRSGQHDDRRGQRARYERCTPRPHGTTGCGQRQRHGVNRVDGERRTMLIQRCRAAERQLSSSFLFAHTGRSKPSSPQTARWPSGGASCA